MVPLLVLLTTATALEAAGGACLSGELRFKGESCLTSSMAGKPERYVL